MTENTATSKEQANEAVELEMKKLSERLPGKTIALASRSAFFADADKQYALNAYTSIGEKKSEQPDRVVVQKGWKLRSTMIAIKHGLLRVLDEKEKDITRDFGGPATIEARAMPIVTNVAKPADPDTDARDRKLIDLLGNPNEDAVLKAIVSRNPTFEALERLLQLEKAGENPHFGPRAKVVDGIIEIMKNTSGITTPGKIVDAEEMTVTAGRT